MVNFKIAVNDEQSISLCCRYFNSEDLREINRYMIGNTECIVYLDEEHNLEITEEKERFNGTSVVRQRNRVRNIGSLRIKINRFSSAFIDEAGSLDRSTLIHYCRNTWEGEGQWETASIENFGLRAVAEHPASYQKMTISSNGTRSTGEYYPFIVIEDKKFGKCCYMEHEGGFSWEIEIDSKGNGITADTTLCAEVNSLNEYNNGLAVFLEPNEEYVTSYVLYGVCDGGFEEATHEILKYKNRNGKILAELPVCFNDYMNCLWATPSAERLIPLIDAAAEAGAEIFCIDANWHTNMGDWIPDDKKFGDIGFKGIIDYIKLKNMLPGVWLEIETAMGDAKILKLSEHSVLTRDGNKIQFEKDCYTLNMNDEKVREYILSVFDRLYDMGIRYIKNDYNHCVGNGCDDVHGKGYGLKKSLEGFYSLIDTVYEKHPDMIIENCGSGALRCDEGTLSHFNLQSTSDQEIYYYNPSIINGTMAFMPISKMGIWSYPIPVKFFDKELGEEIFTSDYLSRFADGEETVFNMITSMFGIMYLSGRIDKADNKNMNLIREGIGVYKKIRKYIKNAIPIFPTGMFKMNDSGIYGIAVKNEEEHKIILAIFRINTDETEIELNLRKWVKENSRIRLEYPACSNTRFSFENLILNVNMEKNNSARLFVIDI